MDKEQIGNMLTGISLILLCLISIVVISMIFMDSTKCYANPLKFSANSLAKNNEANFTCTCVSSDPATANMVCESGVGCRTENKNEHVEFESFSGTNINISSAFLNP